jgi:hypothetical protein
MDRRGRARRLAREGAVATLADDSAPATAPDAIDRARTLERLAAALVALDEPLRVVVMRRYLEGQSAADIARALKIPAGTVRWRLKTGLERLRAALDDSSPRWRLMLAPLTAVKGAVAVKAKTTVLSLLLLLLLIGAGVVAFVVRGRHDSSPATTPTSTASLGGKKAAIRVEDAGTGAPRTATAAVPSTIPGQRRAVVETIAAESGAISGHVINWSTGEGVDGAELTFTTTNGATTVRAAKDGSFELVPAGPGTFSLTTIVSPGFLPYAPELAHSPVRITLAPKQAVRGVTMFLFPALDYQGTVVDAQGAPVAGAKVELTDAPAGEQVLEKIETQWTTDKQGQFTFHAPDGSVFGASHGNARGWAVLDGNVATTRRMTIHLGDHPARDATIRGKVVDAKGSPFPDVLITAVPEGPPGKPDVPRNVAVATSGPDGAFVLEGVDREAYTLLGEDEDLALARKDHVNGGTQNVVITMENGLAIAGVVHGADGNAVPSYTLLVTKRAGVVREVLTSRSVIDPRGRFSVQVEKGDYELLVSAPGWAPSPPVPAAAGKTDIEVTLGEGATLSGTVVDADTGAPIGYARVSREGAGGGASAQPANAGTVTGADGTFELAGIPPGPFTIFIGAGQYNPRLEAGLVATDGGALGPVRLPLEKLAEGETPKIEVVGIGIQLAGEGDALEVMMVVPESGAAAAGIVAGDRIVAVDGIPATTLGVDGAVARIRGVAHTTLSVTLERNGQQVPLVVERKPFRM